MSALACTIDCAPPCCAQALALWHVGTTQVRDPPVRGSGWAPMPCGWCGKAWRAVPRLPSPQHRDASHASGFFCAVRTGFISYSRDSYSSYCRSRSFPRAQCYHARNSPQQRHTLRLL
jgi:hypothetical protein